MLPKELKQHYFGLFLRCTLTLKPEVGVTAETTEFIILGLFCYSGKSSVCFSTCFTLRDQPLVKFSEMSNIVLLTRSLVTLKHRDPKPQPVLSKTEEDTIKTSVG